MRLAEGDDSESFPPSAAEAKNGDLHGGTVENDYEAPAATDA